MLAVDTQNIITNSLTFLNKHLTVDANHSIQMTKALSHIQMEGRSDGVSE